MNRQKVIVCGAGPHCNAVMDVLLADERWQIVGVLDTQGGDVLGVPIIGTDEMMADLYAQGVRLIFVAIGSNRIRQKVAQRAKANGFTLMNVISPHAILSPHCTLGEGVFVNRGAIVNAHAKIGDGTILNTGCTIDHDCCIGQYVHIAPGVHISGSTCVGNGSFLGVGSCVVDGVNIGQNVMIGAGAAVIRDIPDGVTAVGVPAKPLIRKTGDEQHE